MNEYFLCSANALKEMQVTAKSKPFKSGYDRDTGTYYVVEMTHQQASIFENLPQDRVVDFWAWEVSMQPYVLTGVKNYDIARMQHFFERQRERMYLRFETLGLFGTIEAYTNLTKNQSRALVLGAMAAAFGKNPIDFINDIVCRNT